MVDLAFLGRRRDDILTRLSDPRLEWSVQRAILEFLRGHPEVLAALDNPVVLERFIHSFDPVTGLMRLPSPEDDWFESAEILAEPSYSPPPPDAPASPYLPLLPYLPPSSRERPSPGATPPGRSDSELLPYASQAPIPEASPAAQEVNLGRCRVTDIREQGRVETFLPEERRTYPNASKATWTKQVSVSNTISRTVTIQWGKLKAYGGGAGVTLVGVASIQSQVQQQLSKNYSVELRNSITISETTTIEVPPGCTVEHVIKWKLVSLTGVAILGETRRFAASVDLAEVPYQLPLMLAYDEDLNDIQSITYETENETQPLRKRWRRLAP